MAVEFKPPSLFELDDSAAVYFLAGPIQGAPDWQTQAFGFIDQHHPHSQVVVANPRKEHVSGDFDYEAQASWEDKGRALAAVSGGLLFWLAKQDYNLPYEEGRAYAQTTRFEFGEAIGWKAIMPRVRITLGIEPGYTGSERYYLHQARRFGIPIVNDLKQACVELVRPTI